jgi:hypothetical protein
VRVVASIDEAALRSLNGPGACFHPFTLSSSIISSGELRPLFPIQTPGVIFKPACIHMCTASTGHGPN